MAVISAAYADSFAAGARAGIADLAPLLLGADPTQPRAVLAVLDGAMRGQPYVKSALDMACWDITARAADRPLCEALGGRFGDAVPLYNVVTVLPLDEAVALARELVAEGYRRLQVKVGQAPEADAERLAAVRDAVGPDDRALRRRERQPSRPAPRGASCGRPATSSTRSSSRAAPTPSAPRCGRASDRPLVLDESIVTLDDLLRAHRDGVADGITVKLQRVGGITRAMLIRDVAVELGVEVTVEDAGGASLVTAAVVHVGLGTPERACGCTPATSTPGSTSITAPGCRREPTAASSRRRGRGSGSTSTRQRSASPSLDVSA